MRIKNGLYVGDAGIIDYVQSDEKIWVKMIPRIDPGSFAPKSTQKRMMPKKRVFQRNDQMAFTEQLVADINPELARQIRVDKAHKGSTKTF